MNPAEHRSTDFDEARPFQLGVVSVFPVEGRMEGPAGVEQVDPKVMAVLVELARGEGRLVTRDALLERVWESGFVGDDVISRCVYCLRSHLQAATGDTAYRNVIKTLPRRGYLLEMAPVLIVESSEALSAERRKRRPAGRPILLATILAIAALWWWHDPSSHRQVPPASRLEPSIAVLPFVDLSADGSQRHLAEGVADRMISKLASTLAIRVIARSSSFALGDMPLDADQIASRLGITHFIEGSVLGNGTRIWVNAQLIQADTASALWSNRWDIAITDLETIETNLAEAVLRELEIDPLPSPKREAPKGPQAAETLVDFLYADLLIHRRLVGDLETAASMLEDLLDAEPDFSNGWAALASARWLHTMTAARKELIVSEEALSAGLEGARRAAEMAISLDPYNVEALLRLASIMRRYDRFELADKLFERARESDPSNPTLQAIEAGRAVRSSDPAKAIRLLEQALQTDPLATAWRTNLAINLRRAGELDRALSEIDRILAMTGNDSTSDNARVQRVLIWLSQNRTDEALAETARIKTAVSQAYAQALVHTVRGEDASGAMNVMRAAGTTKARLAMAEVLAFRGQSDAAVSEVIAAAEQWHVADSPLLNGVFRDFINSRPLLTPLKTHPDWLAQVTTQLASLDQGAVFPAGVPIRN